MKAMSLVLVALASLCLAGCPDEKAKPDPTATQAKPAQSAAPASSAAPAATPASTGAGW